MISSYKRVLGLIVTLHISGTESSPYVISDDRIRSLDITPVLGRGYSIMTNSFLSTCLMVNDVTIPSYNYDCECHMQYHELDTKQ